jgi:triphosphoribosyl-dephospho-CoA synthase
MSDEPVPERIAQAAQLACLLEVSAPKPGNVSPGVAFGDATYDDFLASAIAIGPALGDAGNRPLGKSVNRAVTATRRWVGANTNLGIVLLLAPLARAAAIHLTAHSSPTTRTVDAYALRRDLARVLQDTTVEDARETYAAIRMASPGGLGTASEQDVASEPTVTLIEAMRLAADRDGIAREYVTDFQTTFESAVPALQAARRDGLGWNDAVVETFLTVLAASTDTHIARRAGAAAADEVTRLARDVVDAGGVRSETGRAALARMHTSLHDDRNSGNPGTTADITAAAIFVVLLGGGWNASHGSGGHDAAPR